MNPVSSLTQLTGDKFNLFAFLPAVNYSFYYLEQGNVTQRLALTTVGAIFISSLLFNFLSKASILESEVAINGEGTSDSSGSYEVDSRGVIVFVIIIGAWFALFVSSLLNLYTMFDSETIWPEALTAGSILFLSLLVSDLLLNKLVPSHGMD